MFSQTVKRSSANLTLAAQSGTITTQPRSSRTDEHINIHIACEMLCGEFSRLKFAVSGVRVVLGVVYGVSLVVVPNLALFIDTEH